MTGVTVRPARLEDAGDLARLFDQLGHPQTVEGLRDALEEAGADPRAGILVADDAGGVVGAATYYFVPVVHDRRRWCRVTALVVDAERRGEGIGRLLLKAAEAAAVAAGCSRIEATSALHRLDAHRLYERLGYGRTSAHFLKRL
jgi:GNAT superfamily N-acetyltransferase